MLYTHRSFRAVADILEVFFVTLIVQISNIHTGVTTFVIRVTAATAITARRLGLVTRWFGFTARWFRLAARRLGPTARRFGFTARRLGPTARRFRLTARWFGFTARRFRLTARRLGLWLMSAVYKLNQPVKCLEKSLCI